MMKKIPVIGVLLCLLILSGCAHYLVNDPKPEYQADYGYRYLPWKQTVKEDEVYVALALSGGGTRAAALSYGVLQKLKATPIRDDSTTLLDEVDVISSVSGGSFTSAYYGLFGEQLFSDFKTDFLYRDIEGELTRKLYAPTNWFRLMSPDFNRIDLAIELYDETVFQRKTYQDLIDAGRKPFIAINATNLTTGAQFTFTQPAFDLLGSDLSSLPVARAVASSSAFPILLSPVSYQNHPASAGFELSRDMRHGLANGYDGPNARRYLWAYNQSIYHTDKAAHPYVHLMDGGLSDNIGVRYIVDNFSRTSGFLSLRKPKIKELVVIIANAKTLPPESLDENESPPNLLDVLYKTTTISMDNYSFESIQVLKDMLHISESAAKLILRCQAIIDQYCSSGHQLTISGHQYKVTVIELNFLNIDDPEKRQRLLSMPTSFKLSRPQVDELINVGGELLDESAAFQELLKRIR